MTTPVVTSQKMAETHKEALCVLWLFLESAWVEQSKEAIDQLPVLLIIGIRDNRDSSSARLLYIVIVTLLLWYAQIDAIAQHHMDPTT